MPFHILLYFQRNTIKFFHIYIKNIRLISITKIIRLFRSQNSPNSFETTFKINALTHLFQILFSDNTILRCFCSTYYKKYYGAKNKYT